MLASVQCWRLDLWLVNVHSAVCCLFAGIHSDTLQAGMDYQVSFPKAVSSVFCFVFVCFSSPMSWCVMLAVIVQLYVFVFDIDQNSHIQVVGLLHQNMSPSTVLWQVSFCIWGIKTLHKITTLVVSSQNYFCMSLEEPRATIMEA